MRLLLFLWRLPLSVEFDSFLASLREASDKISAIDAELPDLIGSDRHRTKIFERAAIVAGLPLSLECDVLPRDVLDKVLSDLAFWSRQAFDSLESQSVFGCSALLIPPGSSVGDKNRLAKLVDSLSAIAA